MLDFSPTRWDTVVRTMDAWWANELDRSVASVHLLGTNTSRPQPKAQILSQQNCLDFIVSAEDVIDRLDYALSTHTILGDGFPGVSLEAFGAGVLAAFLGARMDNSISGVWFHSPKNVPIEDLHFAYNAEHPVFRRILDLCRAGVKKWQGQVQIGMTDLGGVYDVLASFRTTQTLLLDLYDHPDQVLRCAQEIETAWHQYYQAIQEIVRPTNPGYTDWLGLFSSTPCYTTQSDFCYMISPAMYQKFILPELHRTWGRLGHGVYHLDGTGELPHLETMLADPNLHAIQWVPGDGSPTEDQWPEVYQTIHAKGKKILMMDLAHLPTIQRQIGTTQGIACWNNYAMPIAKAEQAYAMLKSIGVPYL